MKKQEENLDDLVQAIGAIVEKRKRLARQVEPQYTYEVKSIIDFQIRDENRIQRLLDFMLEFCFDDRILTLYRQLCRYYFELNPRATASYIDAYREMWDE